MSTKRILAIFFALIIIISISGCGKNDSYSTPVSNRNSFVQISSNKIEDSRYEQIVMYDPETSIMYMIIQDVFNDYSCMTRMFNADGTLRKYLNSTNISSLIKIYSAEIQDSDCKQLVMYDPETLVMYMFLQNNISGFSTVTVMYDANGCPRTYNNSTQINPLIVEYYEELQDNRYKQFVMYDPETLVMYLYSLDSFNSYSTLTVMYNSDGSLRTYNSAAKIGSFVIASCIKIPNSRYKQFIMYDSETSVLYMYYFDYISGDSCITPLYNADGSLRTYGSLSRLSPLQLLSSGEISNSNYRQFIMYDPNTLVMYIHYWNFIDGGSTITVLHNADNSLKLNQ